jgi:hypothetical protein
MKITRAFFHQRPRQGVRIIADSRPAIIKLTPKYFLDLGVAVLSDAKDAEFPWVNNLAYHLTGDETNVKDTTKIVGGTNDPVAVCLARRYWQATKSGKLRHGPVEVPTSEEAQRELEDPTLWHKDTSDM